MKVVSITMVKNEVDIIESFIRYHLNIVDEMIILDNCSSDETPVIINKLIGEGLPVIFLTDLNNNFMHSVKMDILLDKAFNEHEADIVCVLDGDEFLISTNNINPRDILENLDLNEYYLAKWITYVPTENDSYDFFIPKRITHVRDETLERFYKVIVTKEVYNNFSPKLELGSHDLIFPNEETPKKNTDFNLRIAHFPIRSREQCMSKVIVSWPNLISDNAGYNHWGWHWKKIFDKIKTNQFITNEDLKDFAKYYALEDFDGDVKIVNQPINLDFCNDIDIKYYRSLNYLRNVLGCLEEFAKQLVSFKRLFNVNNFSRFNQDYNVIKNSQLFDWAWYLKNYALEDDDDPIVHFLITWRENMNDPARFFSTEFYLKTHKDVDNAGMNPFVHYINHGIKENRKIAPSKYAGIKISIIIPVYNTENYLNQCLDSVLSQDFSDFEVICICDGSTDKSLDILKNYAQNDYRVKVISQINNGPGNARNVGLSHAMGEYVLFVDSDDFLSENSLSQIYDNAESNKSDIVLFDFYQLDEINNKNNKLGCHLKDLFIDKDFNNFTFSYDDIKKHVLNSYFNSWFKLYKKSFIDKIQLVFPEGIYYEDVLFHIKTVLLAEKISYLPKYAYNYRISNLNSIMNDKNKIHDIIYVVNSVESFLKDNDFFEKFEVEFYTFKINQLSQYIRFWGDSDYFKAVKKEFISTNESSGFNFNKLDEPTKATFDKILNSDDEFEFLGIENKYGNFATTNIKVSCVMPVYNCEDFLVDSINSILNQTLTDLELICVDDGSTDTSLEILRDFEKKDSRVKVFSLNHEGGGNARNFALKHVRGEYLYLMDADDILELNAFDDFYSISKSKNLDFLVFKAKKHDVETDEYFETDYYNMHALSSFVKDEVFNFKDIGDLIFNFNVTPWCKFYNTGFIINSGAKFRENSKFHDNTFFWDIIFQAKRIQFLDEFYYTQNIHSKSLIESGNERHIDSIYVANDIIDLFIKHGQFDRFKVNLYNNKVYHNIRRYDEIQDEFKELYFTELKNDFKLLKCTDFRNTLNEHYKFIFDCVLIARNHNDFNQLRKFSNEFTNNQTDDKLKNYKKWYDSLEHEYQQFFWDNPKSLGIYNYLVSVIVPTYNSEEYIDNAFNSLLNQTIGFEKLEIIFVDDDSSDKTPQIIDDYATRYENVVSIHMDENSGYAGKPRNIGINNATCEYLMFLDSDDIFMEGACEILYDEISQDTLDLVSGVHCGEHEVPEYLWLNVLTDPKDSIDYRRLQKENLFENDDFSRKVTSIDEYPSIISNANIWDKIFKKSFIKENNITFPEGVPAEDSVFLFNAFLNANGIKFIDKIILKHFYKRGGSVQNQFSKSKLQKRLDSYYQMFELAHAKNKVRIFSHYLLVTKLQHFLLEQIKLSNLPVGDILDLLEYARPLYVLFDEYGGFTPQNLEVFKDISYGNYGSVFEFIHGNVPRQDEIRIISMGNVSFNYNISSDWMKQFESIKPDLFICNEIFDDINLDKILMYCKQHQIISICLNKELFGLCPDFDYVVESKGFKTILDEINFKYIPKVIPSKMDASRFLNVSEIERNVRYGHDIKKVKNLSEEELSQLTDEELQNYYMYQFVPESACLESSTICQLKCAGCGFQKGEWDDLGRGYLTFENFKKFCEMNPFIKKIELSNYGEMFLNPDLIDMMYYAKENGIELVCLNGTNFNTVTDEQIHALVDSGFKGILLSIDGASQETYSKYRIGGNFDKVIENVKKLQELKKKAGSQFPKLTWQYILMEHNELEIGKAKEMAKELGIPIKFKYNWDKTYNPVHREYIKKETGMNELTRAEYISAHKLDPYNSVCEEIFIRPQINWDGRLLGCCNQNYASFDVNVFEVGLIEAIRSPKYNETKKCLMTVHPDKEKYGSCPCYDCPTRITREKANQAFKP